MRNKKTMNLNRFLTICANVVVLDDECLKESVYFYLYSYVPLH